MVSKWVGSTTAGGQTPPKWEVAVQPTCQMYKNPNPILRTPCDEHGGAWEWGYHSMQVCRGISVITDTNFQKFIIKLVKWTKAFQPTPSYCNWKLNMERTCVCVKQKYQVCILLNSLSPFSKTQTVNCSGKIYIHLGHSCSRDRDCKTITNVFTFVH